MDARIDFFGNPFAGKVLRHINSANKLVVDSTLPAVTQELVKIRASQINGCGFCTDMHTKDAAAAGETQLRLNLVAVWREATVFTEAERAALELTEEGSRLADAALISLIAIINAYNRINVINRQPAGDYVPGQF